MSHPHSSTEQNGDEPLVYTVAQAARLLQCSENHVYNLCAQSLLPHIRAGKLIRIPRWGLLKFLADQSGVSLELAQLLASGAPSSVHVDNTTHKEAE